jgi:hypothetical protein
MPLAERLQRPVHDEARAVGRDLEQDAVRLPEVEVKLVNRSAGRHGSAAARPGAVIGVGDAERDVVNAARAQLCYRDIGLDSSVELRRGPAVSHRHGCESPCLRALRNP